VRKQGRAVIAAIALAAVALFFLPALLGMEPVLVAVRDRVARQLPGRLEVASCSLGWVQGLRCEQLRYHDPVTGVRFEAPQLVSDKGLLLLLAAPSYLGEITIEQPTLVVLPPPPGPDRLQPPDSAAAKQKQSDREGQQKPPWWERLTVRVKMHSGQLVLDQGDAPVRQLARRIDLAGSLAMGTIRYDLRFHSAQQAGHLKAKGFVNLPVAGQSLLETLVSRAELDIVDLEIADFLDLAASRSRVPRGRGVLNASLRLNASGIDAFEARGETVLRDVELVGGVLGEDRPRFDRVGFTFIGSHRKEEGWRLPALDLQSEPVRLHADGSFDGNVVSLVARGNVNLSALAAQAPHLLGLHERTAITGGTADFSLDVAGTAEEGLAVRADCRTDGLRFVHDHHPYFWDTPLALEVHADYGGADTRVHALRLHTPFFEVRGSGGSDDFTLQGEGDLDRTFRELEKIFALNIHARGRAELAAASKRREDGGFDLDSRIAIHDFALSRGQRAVFPGHDFSLTAKAVAAASFLDGGALRSLHLDAVSWPGTLALRVADPLPRPERTPHPCTLRAGVDLERLSGVVHSLGDGTPAPMLRGNLQFDGTGECEGAQVALESGHGTIERLAVAGAGVAIQEPRVTFALGGPGPRSGRQIAVRELTVAENWQHFNGKEQAVLLIDGDRRRLEMRGLGWTTPRAVLETDGVVEDWRQPGTAFSATLRGESDGGLLADLAKAAGWLPPELTVTGRARGTLAAGSAPGRGSTTDLTLEITPFALLHGKKKLFADPRPILSVSLHREDQGKGAIRVPSFLLQTGPVRIEGAGMVARTTPPSLEVQGQITPDYGALVPLLAPLVGRDTVVSGNRPGEFLLSLPLAFPLKSEQLTFTARLPAETLRFQGIGLHQLTLPVDCNRGKLRLAIDGPLDGGRVTLEPVWDLAARQPVMTLPAATQLLKEVALKPGVVQGLLGRLHPLFGAMAHPQGVVDLRVDSFSAPLPEKGLHGPAFVAVVALDRIKFKPAGALRELLDLGGLAQEWLRCREREVACTGKNGRISCGPVHLLAKEAEVGIEGEMGPDGSLRYRVRLPVGQQLAARADLVLHGEATVEAEIGGSRNEPVFDPSSFLAGLANQLRRGGEPTEPGNEEGPSARLVPEKTTPSEAQP